MKVAPTAPSVSASMRSSVMAIAARGTRADPDHPEAAGVGHRGRQLGSCHPGHAGLLEGQATADEVGEARHGPVPTTARRKVLIGGGE